MGAKFKILRKRYPKFIYRSYDYKISGGNLKISFFFEIPPDIAFRPHVIIENIPTSGVGTLDNLVFHAGLIEIISYWKATCSKEIVIEAGYLDKEQIEWWENLIIKGMGQFFYENKIDWRQPNFLRISSLQTPDVCIYRHRVSVKLKDRYLVPFAGGRDSIVTLEELKKRRKKIACFMVNPTKTALSVHRTFYGLEEPIMVQRKIDPLLLKLNKKGYLNGHTPFTAALSFISILCAVLFDYKHIAFSNEKSANEGNVKYLGKMINHQWSKSFEFEKKFKNYCEKYLIKGLNYFSYLRKYTDLEISKMFVKYPKYFSVFSSCNKIGNPPSPPLRPSGFGGQARLQRARWCGECPKCLFVYLTLYSYLEKKDLLKIFGKDLFSDKKLLPIMKSLIGQGSHKPFECVGTYKESREAALLSFEKAKKSGEIPYLLRK